MMVRDKSINKFYAFALAAVFAIALAGCGGGGGTAEAPEPPPMPTPQEQCEAADGEWRNGACVTAAELMAERQAAQRTAINTAIAAATATVNAVGNDSTDTQVSAADTALANARSAIAAGADLSAAEKAANTGTVNALATVLASAKTARQMAMDDKQDAADKAMAKLGKDMYAALDSAGENGSTALDNLQDFGPKAGNIFSITPATEGSTEVKLKAGDSVGSLGGWAGTKYAHTDSGTKVINEAVVYTNQEAPDTKAFGDVYGSRIAGANAGTAPVFTAIKGSLTVNIDSIEDRGRVTGTTFTHSGKQNHAVNSDTGIFTTRGYYDGAPGQYRCTGTCTSTNDGKGSPIALEGTWHFKPDSGAMVSQPDTEYLYYGWWVNKNSDGEPMAASAFAGVVEPNTGDLDNGGDLTVLTGSATYVGHAVGKFATKNMLDGSNDGGHFTADAELEAMFGTGMTAGVTGTIDNFRLNDGSEDPGWSVSLGRATLGSSGGILPGTEGADHTTVWSINGVKAKASGTWRGTMYDEAPGNQPSGDGSNIPTTVTGTFYSEFSDRGRMVGAFGANKQ